MTILTDDSLAEYYKNAGEENYEIITEFSGETALVWPE